MSSSREMNSGASVLRRGDGCEFYCRVTGEGAPLLLIHGAAVDCDFFAGAAAVLAERFRVITYDRGGYGRSACPALPAADSAADYFNAQSDDAAWVLGQLAPGERAVVVGCSCGAVIAAHLAARHPDLVERMILHEPPVYSLIPEDESCWTLIDRVHEAWERGKYDRALNRFLLFFASQAPAGDRPMSQTEMDSLMVNGMTFIRREFVFAFDRQLPVPPVGPDVPVCVLWGEVGEGKPMTECARRVAQILNCPLYKVPGGHNEARDEPARFARTVRSLIQGE